jgi:hypothetical protein
MANEPDQVIPDHQGNGFCPYCKNPEEISFGLAGGGYGVYGYCPNCNKVLWKVQEREE